MPPASPRTFLLLTLGRHPFPKPWYQWDWEGAVINFSCVVSYLTHANSPLHPLTPLHPRTLLLPLTLLFIPEVSSLPLIPTIFRTSTQHTFHQRSQNSVSNARPSKRPLLPLFQLLHCCRFFLRLVCHRIFQFLLPCQILLSGPIAVLSRFVLLEVCCWFQCTAWLFDTGIRLCVLLRL